MQLIVARAISFAHSWLTCAQVLSTVSSSESESSRNARDDSDVADGGDDSAMDVDQVTMHARLRLIARTHTHTHLHTHTYCHARDQFSDD